MKKSRGFWKPEGGAGITKALEHSGHLKTPGLGVHDYAEALKASFLETQVTVGGSPKKNAKLHEGLRSAKRIFYAAHRSGNKVIFVGNGGSAAIASHIATDYTKNAGIRSIAFNDASTLTCMANDFGYEEAFGKLVEFYGLAGDILVCISSSGMSENIISAAAAAMDREITVITLSGFADENRLRGMGEINFWVPAGDYGLIEITHLSILHTITSLGKMLEW